MPGFCNSSMKTKFIHLLFPCLVFAILFYKCTTSSTKNRDISEKKEAENVYAAHSGKAEYVGINTCKLCHQDIYNSFIRTGMGRSFHLANLSNSKALFNNTGFYDLFSDFYYRAFSKNDSLFIHEFRLEKKDTVYQRTEQINFIVGSGQHTNSHIQNINGYLHQMPMTFYTQKGKWDLPPGFENGVNTRFTRRIGLECMSCHNGFPKFVLGSENKYEHVPQGIDCERCHGPGSEHVAQKQAGKHVDTSKHIDYSIINPAKLPIDLQFDLCQRCHLQGNAVLKNEHSFYDYVPGKKLSDYITVFLPRYKNADDEFIMASHADRLKQSPCFIKSIEKQNTANSLKPYRGALTCITCHNPHKSVKETGSEVFDNACKNCHEKKENINLPTCSDKKHLAAVASKSSNKNLTSCVNCHMPRSGSIDIPHVTVHDHYIRKPVTKTEKEKIKTFIGLYAINESNPNYLTKATAWLQQFEKFEADKSYLDSAQFYLLKIENSKKNNLNEWVWLYFLKGNTNAIISLLNENNENHCFEKLLNKKSFDNKDAWTCYRIAEAWNGIPNYAKAEKWMKKCCDLAPYHPDFWVKYGNSLAKQQKGTPAINAFLKALELYPKNISALTSLGYLYLANNEPEKAIETYRLGLTLDPDYEPLLINMAGYYIAINNKNEARRYLVKILKKNPENKIAQSALKKIENIN